MVDPRTSSIGRGSDDREDVAMCESSENGWRSCLTCGGPVPSYLKGVRKDYCCRACYPDWLAEICRINQATYEAKRKGRTYRALTTVKCVWCWQPFHPRRGSNTNRTCSRECDLASRHGPRLGEVVKIKTVRQFACVGCEVTFESFREKKWCSERCRHLHQTSGKFEYEICYSTCGQCGKLFVSQPHHGAKFCSSRCSKKIHKKKRRRHRSLKGSDSIGTFELGDRDGWICHLCGKKVPRRQYRNTPMCPTVDHLIPVSAGGPHTWDNVALAHNRCNYERREFGEVQLRLLG